MADNGAPTDDWSAFPDVQTTADNWSAFPDANPSQPTMGAGTAAALGAASGLTGGWLPWLANKVTQAGGMEEAQSPYLPDNVTESISNPKTQIEAGKEAQQTVLRAQKEAQEQHPYLYGAGEIAGMVPLAALAPESGAGFIPKVVSGAKFGAGYGALSGAGQAASEPDASVASIAGGALSGAGFGAIGGAGGAALGEGLAKAGGVAYDILGRPIASLYQGLRDPEGVAAKRAAGALIADQPQVAAGVTPGLTQSAWEDAQKAGQPVVAADLGGETTRAMLRSAANTSPEARAMIQQVVQDRFENQSERLGSEIRQLTGGANATATRDMLQAAYDKTKTGLYRQAYDDGDRPIMTPQLERLTGSPAVVGAMRSAINQGQDRAIAQGMGAFNPGVNITQDGRILFNQGKNGFPIYPNLQFWDYTYRALRDQSQAAFRVGRNSEGSALQGLASSMRQELDNQVPSYANARGVAAQFFGGQDALEAGQKAVNFKGDPALIQQQVAKMQPSERALFQEGYASALAQKIESANDRSDVSRMIYNSPQERAKMNAVFGPRIGSIMEPLMQRERVFNAVRSAASGNSSTAQQLIQAGLAGGTGGAFLEGYTHGWSPMAMLEGAKEGAEYGLAARAGLKGAGAALNKTIVGYVNRNVAKNVAKFLTSDDPAEIMRGLQMARNNPKIAQGLRDIATALTRNSGVNTAGAIPPPQIPQLQPPVAAQENQNGGPGVLGQHKAGGAVKGQGDEQDDPRDESDSPSLAFEDRCARRHRDGYWSVLPPPDKRIPGRTLFRSPQYGDVVWGSDGKWHRTPENARRWLAAHPNDPRAPAVSTKLRQLGFH